MKVLQIHNIYQGKTGEETVVEEERRILVQHGHQVIQFVKDNSSLKSQGVLSKAKMVVGLRSSKSISRELEQLILAERPDICHVHNTFPLLTPEVFHVCQKLKVPVVKTLHNYKMVCTNSLMFRDGEVCDVCLNKSLYHSIKYKCYRNSYLATAAQADVIQHHRKIGTWDYYVDQYFALTEFQKQLLINGGGIPAGKVTVKPNFIRHSDLEVVREGFFLFVGKVDDYKGLQDLLGLFDQNTTSEFIVIGRCDLEDPFKGYANVTYLGEQSREVTLDHMRRCKAVLFPSKYYEGMPMVILEAFSHKKAVISRNRGAMSSMIKHESNGLNYESVNELVNLIARAEKEEGLIIRLGDQAYSDFQELYTDKKGYENLINAYEQTINGYDSDLA